MGQVTVFSGAQRRRRWSDDEKLALVEAAIAPGASVAEVARSADLDASLIYRWRRELCGTQRKTPVAPAGFAKVSIEVDASVGMTDAVLVIEVNGATLRAPPGASVELLSTALREVLA